MRFLSDNRKINNPLGGPWPSYRVTIPSSHHAKSCFSPARQPRERGTTSTRHAMAQARLPGHAQCPARIKTWPHAQPDVKRRRTGLRTTVVPTSFPALLASCPVRCADVQNRSNFQVDSLILGFRKLVSVPKGGGGDVGVFEREKDGY